MKITRIRKARNYRIFRDFTWPAGLSDFGRFNVIYGWNGVGKTSMSNIFRHLQNKAVLTEGDVEIQVDQTPVAGKDFDQAALPAVRVFNRDTIDRNVFELSGQQFPPVFYLGEDSVEKQIQIEQMQKQHAQHKESESKMSRANIDAKATLEALCAEEAKGIKNLLTVAGGGPYNNYNSANFKADIKALSLKDHKPILLTESEQQNYLSLKETKIMERIPAPSLPFPDFVDLTARTNELLERSLISSTIAELVDNPRISNWVSTGVHLHVGEHASEMCRFCAQPLPKERVAQLEAHFNDEFMRFQHALDALMREVENAMSFEERFRTPPKEALYRGFRKDYESARDTLSQSTKTLRLSLAVLQRALKAKRDDPFKPMELSKFISGDGSSDYPVGTIERIFQVAMAGTAAFSAAVGQGAFEKLSEIVDKHNQRTDHFDQDIKEAREKLAQNELVRSFGVWSDKSSVVAGTQDSAEKERDKAIELARKISDLEREIRQHRRPADELNVEVAAYLGRDELRFHVEKNGYRITRGGQPAVHLSDGERTAIAFLYFLKSLSGTDFDLATGTVVIDDPVSSLDANSIFSAFGFMKERTQTAGQLFVLTHNFTFFRQVRNWYYNMDGQKKKETETRKRPAKFFMLTSTFIDGQRTARLGALDSFLHRYESEYHYLFKRVYEEANKGAVPNLEAYYTMPNIARRLLESFLAFRVPDRSGELYEKLQSTAYDIHKKTRILRFLHTFSHFDQIAQPEHDMSVLAETPEVLRDVLDLMKHCDHEHCESMMRLTTLEDEEA